MAVGTRRVGWRLTAVAVTIRLGAGPSAPWKKTATDRGSTHAACFGLQRRHPELLWIRKRLPEAAFQTSQKSKGEIRLLNPDIDYSRKLRGAENGWRVHLNPEAISG